MSAVNLLRRSLGGTCKAVLREYDIYRMYRWTGPSSPHGVPAGFTMTELADGSLLRHASDPAITQLAQYAGQEAFGFALLRNGTPVCGCWYWHGERYATKRGFWPMQADEANLVQINTTPRHRCQGLATALIAESAARMHEYGFSRLYARVWHSNSTSRKAFRNAGWKEIAYVVGLPAFNLKWIIRRPSALSNQRD